MIFKSKYDLKKTYSNLAVSNLTTIKTAAHFLTRNRRMG
jgi:hypothetical protein